MTAVPHARESGGADDNADRPDHLRPAGEPTERDRQAEGAGLDAYSQVVTRVAAVLLPSVASLRGGADGWGKGTGSAVAAAQDGLLGTTGRGVHSAAGA